jgi:hypothetical protein
MFGKKKDDDIAAADQTEKAEVQPRNYQRSEPAQPASRPAVRNRRRQLLLPAHRNLRPSPTPRS